MTSESLNCTTLHRSLRERVPYVDIARNKRVETSIDATMGFSNTKRVTAATNKMSVKHS